MKARLSAPVVCATALAALFAVAGPASAHHSAVIYDRMHPIILQGVVKNLEWSNPHGIIDLLASQTGSSPKPWTIEMEGPNVMQREGWSRNSLMPGDHITAQVMPLKDGRAGARLIELTKADGTVLRLFTPRPADAS